MSPFVIGKRASVKTLKGPVEWKRYLRPGLLLDGAGRGFFVC